jgi:hypothetical protein
VQKDVCPGIDVALHGRDGVLEYDFSTDRRDAAAGRLHRDRGRGRGDDGGRGGRGLRGELTAGFTGRARYMRKIP